MMELKNYEGHTTQTRAIQDTLGKVQDVSMFRVSWHTKPRHKLQSYENFTNELNTKYPDLAPSGVEFTHLHSEGYVHDPEVIFLRSNCTYSTREKNASKHVTLKNYKRNTYILCPICDPFKVAKEDPECKETAKITIDGKTKYLNRRSPLHEFYNTLGSGYVNHMLNCHGVYRNGVFKQPHLVFAIDKVNSQNINLVTICPYEDINGEPCLEEIPYSTKTGHGFKAYFRHAKCHINERKATGKSQQANRRKHNKDDRIIVPVFKTEFESMTRHLCATDYFDLCTDASLNKLISGWLGENPELESGYAPLSIESPMSGLSPECSTNYSIFSSTPNEEELFVRKLTQEEIAELSNDQLSTLTQETLRFKHYDIPFNLETASMQVQSYAPLSVEETDEVGIQTYLAGNEYASVYDNEVEGDDEFYQTAINFELIDPALTN